MEILGDFL